VTQSSHLPSPRPSLGDRGVGGAAGGEGCTAVAALSKFNNPTGACETQQTWQVCVHVCAHLAIALQLRGCQDGVPAVPVASPPTFPDAHRSSANDNSMPHGAICVSVTP